jgi:hypothetical protein
VPARQDSCPQHPATAAPLNWSGRTASRRMANQRRMKRIYRLLGWGVGWGSSLTPVTVLGSTICRRGVGKLEPS